MPLRLNSPDTKVPPLSITPAQRFTRASIASAQQSTRDEEIFCISCASPCYHLALSVLALTVLALAVLALTVLALTALSLTALVLAISPLALLPLDVLVLTAWLSILKGAVPPPCACSHRAGSHCTSSHCASSHNASSDYALCR